VADHDQVTFASRAAWRSWLAEHHADEPGVWAVTYKQASGKPYVPYGDLRDEALCFGWIDSLRRSVDDERTRLLMTPRKPKSGWSKVNKARIEELRAAGLMTPAGEAAIETAKANGAWTKLDEVEQGIEPDDLRAALDADPDARRHWDAFPRSAKRGILEWISNAKRPETREKRVRETATLAAENVRANHPRQPKGAG
jgi:uncharacterized protein YdeI (YjbR/CyaY-like superfamily)